MRSHVDLPVWFFPLILVIVIIAICVGCTPRVSPVRMSRQEYSTLNLQDELDRAIARGDKVRKMPHGDFAWDWCKEGETWDFQRWHYEIVRP